jgi:hypothetical protein
MEEVIMGFNDVEQKMSGFWQRQNADTPELANSGRHESHTAKYDIGISRY